jgi:hypothetical protein
MSWPEAIEHIGIAFAMAAAIAVGCWMIVKVNKE